MDALLSEVVKALLSRLPVSLLLILLAALSVEAVARKRTSTTQLDRLRRGLATFSRIRSAVVVTFAVLIVLATMGVAYGRHSGLLPYLTVEGRLRASPARDLSNALVIALRKDPAVAENHSRVAPSGYFSFDNLYRDVYRFLAFEVRNDSLMMSAFGRNLRSRDSSLREYDYPLESRRLVPLATLQFDTAQHRLEDEALIQLQGLLDLKQAWSHHVSKSKRINPHRHVRARRVGALVDSGNSR